MYSTLYTCTVHCIHVQYIVYMYMYSTLHTYTVHTCTCTVNTCTVHCIHVQYIVYMYSTLYTCTVYMYTCICVHMHKYNVYQCIFDIRHLFQGFSSINKCKPCKQKNNDTLLCTVHCMDRDNAAPNDIHMCISYHKPTLCTCTVLVELVIVDIVTPDPATSALN